MKNIIYTLFFAITFLLSCKHVPVEKYKNGDFISELPDPRSIEPLQEWKNQTSELTASWASTNYRFRKNYIPNANLIDDLELHGWKNERINAQMLIWSTDTLMDISIEVSDLVNADNRISAENIKHYYVRNVICDEFLKGCGPRENKQEHARLFPDAFETLEAYNHPGRTTRSVWFTIQVPAETIQGRYSGKVSLKNPQGTIKELPLQLTVANYTLPDPKDWVFHLDLWQNPYAVARVENVEVWSEQHFDAMRPLYEMLADAGQKCITATISPKPWGGQTLDPYGSMVNRMLMEDGSWEFEYQVFDRWIDFMTGIGINKEINCYSLISWDENYHYFDKMKGEDVIIQLTTGSEAYKSYWAPFLFDFHNHLASKGILDITTIAIDERPPELMQALAEMIKEHAPGLKISMATNHMYHSDNIYDLSIGIRFLPEDPEIIQNRRKNGLITTFYTACNPPFPNTYSFSPPSESTWMGWFASANNLDGYLRWAYNSWVEDPLKDTRFRRWPSGDAFLVYPGSRSSIRFEKLRDGFEDFEKIHILRKELTDDSDAPSLSKLELLDEYLDRFKQYPPTEEDIPKNIEEAQLFLNRLLK